MLSSAFNDRSAMVVADAWIKPRTDDVPDTIELMAFCLLFNVDMICMYLVNVLSSGKTLFFVDFLLGEVWEVRTLVGSV